MEDTRISGDLAPALSARLGPADPRYGRLLGLSAPVEAPITLPRELLDLAGHELRTAAAALLGLGELWESGSMGPLAATQREAVQRVKECGETVLRHVNDLLLFTRLEDATLEVRREPVPALDLLQRTMSRLQPALDAKHHRLEIGMDLPLPTVTGDPELLLQALGNMLDQACRLTPAGGQLTLRAAREGELAVWEISDDGPERWVDEAVFDPARHAPRLAQARTGGTALGLAMARRIAEQHGGTLELNSRPEGGCVARMCLPLSGEG